MHHAYPSETKKTHLVMFLGLLTISGRTWKLGLTEGKPPKRIGRLHSKGNLAIQG